MDPIVKLEVSAWKGFVGCGCRNIGSKMKACKRLEGGIGNRGVEKWIIFSDNHDQGLSKCGKTLNKSLIENCGTVRC